MFTYRKSAQSEKELAQSKVAAWQMQLNSNENLKKCAELESKMDHTLSECRIKITSLLTEKPDQMNYAILQEKISSLENEFHKKTKQKSELHSIIEDEMHKYPYLFALDDKKYIETKEKDINELINNILTNAKNVQIDWQRSITDLENKITEAIACKTTITQTKETNYLHQISDLKQESTLQKQVIQSLTIQIKQLTTKLESLEKRLTQQPDSKLQNKELTTTTTGSIKMFTN